MKLFFSGNTFSKYMCVCVCVSVLKNEKVDLDRSKNVVETCNPCFKSFHALAERTMAKDRTKEEKKREEMQHSKLFRFYVRSDTCHLQPQLRANIFKHCIT